MLLDRKMQLTSVCIKHDLALVYLFGSQVANGAKLLAGDQVLVADPLTDLDVGIVTYSPLPPAAERALFFASLFNDLEDIFKPLKLDLVLLEENHSVFQVEAIKGICVYRISVEKREEYELDVLRRSADFRPFLRQYLQERLEEI